MFQRLDIAVFQVEVEQIPLHGGGHPVADTLYDANTNANTLRNPPPEPLCWFQPRFLKRTESAAKSEASAALTSLSTALLLPWT